MTNERDKNSVRYAKLILDAIGVLFNPESDSYIGSELKEGEVITDFMHAVANMAPNAIYYKLTSEDVTNLEFNHLANRLCFQYAIIKKEEAI